MTERFRGIFDSADRLNPDGVLATVYQLSSCRDVSDKTCTTFFNTVKRCIKDLNTIKQNAPFRDFVGRKVGSNLEKGFYNLRQAGLLLNIDRSFEDGGGISPYHYNNEYAFVLTVGEADISSGSPQILSTKISHEFGHMLKYAATYPHDFAQYQMCDPDQQAYTNDYQNNWKMEFDADAIAIASNTKNEILDSLVEKRKGNYLSRMYQKGIMPDWMASSISDICQKRNVMLINKIRERNERFGEQYGEKMLKRLQFVDVLVDITHPPTITRAVEQRKFKKEIDLFLANS